MGDHTGGAGRKSRAPLQYETFDSYTAAKNFMDRHYGAQLEVLEATAVDALGAYTTNAGYGVNDYLRNGKDGYDRGLSVLLVADLDRAFANITAATLTHNITVTRGFGNKTDWIKTLEVGDIFTDRAFVSTAVKPVNVSSTYRIAIQVPAGTRGFWLEPITVQKTEYELLLDRGTSFKVTGKSVETGLPILTVIGQRR